MLQRPRTSVPEGPYTVSFVDGGKYKLRDDHENEVDNGELFKEQHLRSYTPFG